MMNLIQELLNLLYPRRCPICQEILTERGALICTSCRKKAVPIGEPKCKKCGKPLRAHTKEYCGDCSDSKHFFTRGWSVFSYSKEIKQSVYQFKFHNKREYGEFYASEMVRVCGGEILAWNPDIIIPIPMYQKKQRKRGYNQAEILARLTGEKLGILVEKKLLRRVRNTVPQKELSRKEREQNLKCAFEIQQEAVTSKKILLVDDIYTTGATMDAAAETLLLAGALEVRFLTLCIGHGDG